MPQFNYDKELLDAQTKAYHLWNQLTVNKKHQEISELKYRACKLAKIKPMESLTATITSATRPKVLEIIAELKIIKLEELLM